MESEDLVNTGFSSNVTPIMSVIPDIVSVINSLRLPSEIIQKSVDIYYRLESDKRQLYKAKTIKQKRKARRIFLCIFIAYNELDQPVDPILVARLVDLPIDEIEHAFNESGAKIVVDPVKLSRHYTQMINSCLTDRQLSIEVVEFNVDRIITVCKRTPVGREILDNNSVKYITVGALMFYLSDIAALNIPRSVIEHATHLSWACINKHQLQIAQLYNS